MSLPSFSVKNSVLVNMLMVVTVVAGAMFALTLTREMFPESRPDKLAIMVVYPGVQPQEIEKAVTIKIEEAVRDVEGVDKVDSSIQEGFSTTIVTLFNEVKNTDAILQLVKNEVDAIQNLPDEIEQITFTKLEPKLPVISVAIYGDGAEADRKQAARMLRDDLLLLPGVSEVEIAGTRDDEISVEIRPERLLEYDVTFAEVAEAIRQTNLDVSGGNLKGERAIVSVRTLGEESRGRDLEDLVVRTEPDGRQITLSQVAEIRDAFVDVDLESYFNGKPAAHCVVYKTKSQDAIQIASLVKAYVSGKQGVPFDPYGFAAAADASWYVKPFALLGAGVSWMIPRISGRPIPEQYYEQSRAAPFPHDFQVALHTDLARYLEGRLDLMTRNGRNGLILVLLTLNLFLNWRVAFWASAGLPVSLFGTFVVMWVLGSTINLLTLFGLIIVLGIIVDDAIVIGENIYRHVEEGMPAREAAVHGAEEVMWPVIVAVVTTIAAFAPLFFIKGQIGDFMGQLPIVVMAALTVSLIEALVVLPSHLSHLPPKRPAGPQPHGESTPSRTSKLWGVIRGIRSRMLHGMLPQWYERLLRTSLSWRYVTIATGVGVLLMSFGLLAGGIVEWVFIQKMDSETLLCALEMPVGTPTENVKQQLLTLSDFASRQPEVKNVQMHVGRQYDVGGAGTAGVRDQSHLGQLVVELAAADEREQKGQRSSQQLLTALRNKSMSLPGVNSVTWDAVSGGPGGKDIHIQITGPDFEDNVQVTERLKQELQGYQGVFDIKDDYERGKREVRLRLRESARPTGITVASLGRQVRSAMYGEEARRITRNREDVKIMVRYPERFRKNVYQLESMWIPTDRGAGTTVSVPDTRSVRDTSSSGGERGWVPLGEVAELTEAEGYTTIHRSQQQRSVTVYGDVDQETADTSEILDRIRETFDRKIAPEHPGTRIEFLGSYEEMTKAFSSLQVAFPVALLLIYMLLAGLFRSYVQPLVVMSAIPFGIVGAIVGHWVTGHPMTILSRIGMVALAGIVVNDSLILVDFINGRVRQGMSHFEASVEGAKLRLRAILLTTLTTVAGLTPLMFETSFQAKFLIPMAVTLTFGLMFATLLTLLIVPALNLAFYDVRDRLCSVVGPSSFVTDEGPTTKETGQRITD